MHLAIIGNGITGVTCARLFRKGNPDARVTIISDESDYFYSRTALMYIYMGDMTYGHTKPYADDFWQKNRIELVRDRVEHVDTESKSLELISGQSIAYDVLLIATGSKSTFYDWPGQDLVGVQGLYSLQDLEQMERWTEDVDRAVVVGGGLIGVEIAEMLRVRGIDVTFLVREDWYMSHILPEEEGRMVEREIRSYGVDLRLSTELKEILEDENGRARAVRTSTGEVLPAQFVGLTTGVQPNVDFLRGSGIEMGRGVRVDRHFRTNVEHVYAAGDCAEFRDPPQGHQSVEQLWYTGRAHGVTLARTLLGQPTAYNPGPFFNSAKFFDIEYQTYGRIDPKLPEGKTSIYWEHPDGKKAIRIQHEASGSKPVVGVNLMGIRHRHAVWREWISRGMGIEKVLSLLPVANFDPEFAGQCERELISTYNQMHGTSLQPSEKKGWKRWMAVLPMRGNLNDRTPADSFSHL